MRGSRKGEDIVRPHGMGNRGIADKGLIDLAYRSGEIQIIQAHAVCENDEFSYEFGLEPKLTHKPAVKDRGEPIAFYAMFKTKDGGYGFDVMSVDDVRAHAAKYSKSFNSGFSPWKTNFVEMALKGLALDTEIPTPTGWTTMEHLKVGDEVFDMNGKTTKVIAVSEVKNLPCYKVTFSNSCSVICDNEHQWYAEFGSRARENVNAKGWAVTSIDEMYERKNNGESVIVPIPAPLELPDANLPVDPWLLGYWLGDGSKDHASISCCDEWADEVVDRINSATPYKVENTNHDKRNKSVQINVRDGFKVALRELGVLGNKHIPEAYLRGSVSQRLALLQGLMDSDGTINAERGRARFYSTDKALRDGVAELVSSLGEVCSSHENEAQGFGVKTIAYCVEWQPANFEPVTLKHHVAKLRERKLVPYLSVKSIEKVDSVPTKCIAVESDTKSYLCGRGFYVTHNTVLKRVLKYAPLKTEFVRGVTQDETIHTTIGADMTLEETREIESEGSISENAEYVDPDTGEVTTAPEGTESK